MASNLFVYDLSNKSGEEEFHQRFSSTNSQLSIWLNWMFVFKNT